MFYPHSLEDNNTRSLISTWKGYNHNYIVGAGEFYDMENLTSDNYPLFTPRKTRSLLGKGENIRGVVLTDNNVCYMDGDTLHYSTKQYDLSEYISDAEKNTWQTLLRFGAYILIFPLGIYVNIYDNDDIGIMKNSFTSDEGITITYSICDSNGDDFENVVASSTAPTEPSDGEYWLNTGENSGLNIWNASKSMWEPVATTYIRIHIPEANLKEYFKQYDTVNMNTTIPNVNDGSQIQSIENEYIVVIGLIPDAVTKTETTSSAWKLKIERKIPNLDYVCADKNRVWGCHYGYSTDGEMLNEIYCCKLADFKNWYTYQGISTDSYAVSVGVPGEWTGCISFQGHPTFFKENAIFTIYGSYPAEYQIVQNDCRGVQKGSFRSLAVVNEYLFYKSASDIVVYDGSTPASISEDLSRKEMFYDAVGGGCMNKYYISMQNAKAKRYLFTYDLEHDIWEKESTLPLLGFSSTENGQIYGVTDKKIYGFGTRDNMLYLNPYLDEEWVEWFAETGEIGYDTPDYKRVNGITLRAYIPTRSEIQVSISYDDDPYEEVETLRGNDTITSHKMEIQPHRADHYKIRLAGHGDCRIYSMSTTQENGSEEHGYQNQ